MNDDQKNVITLRQTKEKELILEQLRRIPIIQVACEKAGVARATFYRLRNDDPNFKLAIEEAVTEGVALITDMSEVQVISLIKDKNWSAISFWLRAHSPKYSTKVELTTKIQREEILTDQQKELIQKALSLATLPEPNAPQTNEQSK